MRTANQSTTNSTDASSINCSRARSRSMTRFTIIEDDDLVAGSSNPIPKKRRTHESPSEPAPEDVAEESESQESEEDEDEEDSEGSSDEGSEDDGDEEIGSEIDGVVGDSGRVSQDPNVRASVSLSDPDVLDCPICYNSLTIPVFQCENGHIACGTCCPKIYNKCPSCAMPIGYNRCRAMEKILDVARVSCPNTKYGCKESLPFSKKTEHESTCLYAPCSCPALGCSFLGFSKDLYNHFRTKHSDYGKSFTLGSDHSEVLYLYKNQKLACLYDKVKGTIFVVNHRYETLGSAVNVICIGPASSRRMFRYDVVANYDSAVLQLQSVAENTPKWSPDTQLKRFLLVPRYLVDASPWTMVRVRILAD